MSQHPALLPRKITSPVRLVIPQAVILTALGQMASKTPQLVPFHLLTCFLRQSAAEKTE